MKGFLAAALLLSGGVLWAQSLGDVARAQKNQDRPKAKRVITNGDLSPGTDAATAPDKPMAQPSPENRAAAQNANERKISAAQQRRIQDLSQRVQLLQAELKDLEEQRVLANRAALANDPSHGVQNREDLKRISEQIDAKLKEMASVRNELAEEVERARRSSVER